jgi:hypothetical protein
MKQENISSEKALYILQKDDQERRKWGMQMYGKDTWDSRLYDIVLNIKNLSVDDAVDILFDIVQKPNYKSTPESLKTLEDLALSAKIKVGLFHLATQINIQADDGKVTIDMADDIQAIKNKEKIEKLTQKMEGVKEVTFSGKEPIRDNIFAE